MRKVLALLLILFPLFITACATSGGNVIEPKDRTAALMEALAENPTGTVSEEEEEIALPTPESVREEREKETEAVPQAPVVETVKIETEETTAQPMEEEESTVPPAPVEEVVETPEVEPEEENVVISFQEPEEKEEIVIPAPDTEEDGADIIPVSGDAEEAEPVIYPVESTGVAESRSIMDEPMAPWMLRLMAVLVVDMILFTAASAIRNAYKAPLNRLVSFSIAVLLTALSWVLSYIIAGPSLIYAAYLLLLFTYFVLRSTGRNNND